MRARPLASVAAGLCLLVGLSGCEKPTPGVTVSSGTHSKHLESTIFCRAGQDFAKGQCVQHLHRQVVLTVKDGELVGFDVDDSLAKHGWAVIDAAANTSSGIQDSHHYSYTPQFDRRKVIVLQLKSLDRVADDAKVTGVWQIQLVQD